jgi:hypothetical protein
VRRNGVVHAIERSPVGLAVLGLSAMACASATRRPPAAETPAPAAEPARAPVVRHAIAKLALGNAVVAIYASDSGTVDVGASAPGGTVLLHFLPADVTTWAAATTKILSTPARVRRRRDTVVAPTTLTEPGVTAGALTFERRATRRATSYSLFFANRHFGGFPVTITRQDARALVAALLDAARKVGDATGSRPDTRTPPYTSRARPPARARADSA